MNQEHELRVFQLLADTIGETLEQVYNMQDLERTQLITALDIEKKVIKVDITDEEDTVSTAIPSKLKNDKSDDTSKLNDSNDINEGRGESNTDTNEEAKDEGDENTTMLNLEDNNNNDYQPIVLGEGFSEDVHPALVSLKKDTELVLRLLGEDKKVTQQEVEAYLEAHMNRHDRVQVVVEELAGIDDEDVDHQALVRQVSLEQKSMDKGKGISGKHVRAPGISLGKRPFPFSDSEAKVEGTKKQRIDNDGIEVFSGVDRSPAEVPAVMNNDIPAESVGQEIVVLKDEPEETVEVVSAENQIPTISLLDSPLLEIASSSKAEPEKDPVDHTAISTMVDDLSQMFPHTPLEYLRARCPDLIGRDAALARFTEELLVSQTPPPDWRQIYLPMLSQEDQIASPGPSGRSVVISSPSIVPSGTTSLSTPHPILEWEVDKIGELQSLFPTISPQYLEEVVRGCCRVEGRFVDNEVTLSLINAFQSRVENLFSLSPNARARLPTRAQWQIRMKEKAELEKWSGNMSPADFLDIYEDPSKYFNSKREVSEDYKTHAIADLKGRFRYHSVTKINQVFRQCGYMLTPSVAKLTTAASTRNSKRPEYEIRTAGAAPSIDFLKEKKFLELEKDIREEKNRRVKMIEDKLAAGRLAGSLVECECCYNTECLMDDMVRCGGGHIYCTECVETSTKVAMGEGKTEMMCLGQCDEEISWQELSRALKPNILSKLIQKRQEVEVKKAELENVVACPFCPYLAIMENLEDKVLVCKNPECGRESCRLCKEPNHIPLRCEEVEKGEEARKKIEEKLTEAMLRECLKCGYKFYKEEGCNKMTCRCGAKMCYLCRKEVKDYSHFYGQGGTPTATKTCPLFSDIKKIHQLELSKVAKEAKQELEKANLTLSIDPTKDVMMLDDVQESDDEVRGKLFNVWIEVTAKVEIVQNKLTKTNLQNHLEAVRVKIGGNNVKRLEKEIHQELESIRIKAETG